MAIRRPQGALTKVERRIVKSLLAQGWRNQDIQALVNTNRKATINSARITEVKSNARQAAAAEEELEFYLHSEEIIQSYYGFKFLR